MGKLEVQDITTALQLSLKIRKQLTDQHQKKLNALSEHLYNNQYCIHLQSKGELDNCDFPPKRDDPNPIRPGVKLLYEDRSHYQAKWIYDDRGTGAKKSVSVWKVNDYTDNCFSLGHYGVKNQGTPKMVRRYCTDAENVETVFARPRTMT